MEIKSRTSTEWAQIRKCNNSQLSNYSNARLPLKLQLFRAEVVEAVLYG